ncbi:MAG: tetratricopeptide repeat protein [Flavobacteriales bacterium]|nr:tetratricopeptide repeat protein [Flavobacteriales bacterium]
MKDRRAIILLAAFFLLILSLAYSNHFTNGFYFDDYHTIVDNSFIEDISNLPLFFTDIVTYGTIPSNRGYRPIVTSLNAIDYWIAGDLDPFYFHLSIFFWYVVQLVLMFYLLKNIFNLSAPNKHNELFALVFVAFYGLHAANAETMNYIIMRSDSFSTLCIVASLLLYQIPKFRKYHLYLITMIIGIGTKETGAVFVPILFFYILLFEENISLSELVLLKKPRAILNTLKKSAPALIVTVGLLAYIAQYIFPQDTILVEYQDPSYNWRYFITQWSIIAHYLGNFVIPINLSVDKDFQFVTSIINHKTLFSLGLILLLVAIAFRTSKRKRMLPIAFGILWFFFALAPTSSVIPMIQLGNDHRTFFPYIGLVVSLGWYTRLMIIKYEEQIRDSWKLKIGLPLLALLFLMSHAYGVRQRNKVWSSSETLWYEATVKSPNNGRVQMNYGLTQMNKGKLDVALEYFTRAEALLPTWAAIHINMGIIKQATGHPEEAEKYFLNAVAYQPSPISYYHYARWLNRQSRKEEAMRQLEIGHSLNPDDTKINILIESLSGEVAEIVKTQIKAMEETVQEAPTSGNLLNLSISYYRNGQFRECIFVCKKILATDPTYVDAYNNICIAYNKLAEWDKAIAACEKAIELAPDYQLAKNNLRMVVNNKANSE